MCMPSNQVPSIQFQILDGTNPHMPPVCLFNDTDAVWSLTLVRYILYSFPQIKVRKAENDLLIDQLKECFQFLGKHKVPVSKAEKRLEDVRQRWDTVKKSQPQVKTDVQPIQQTQGDRIRTEIEEFSSRVKKYKTEFYQREFFKSSTGFVAAYPEIDQVTYT